ncbi:MAG: response regulator transcription factor [Spirochaetota bacterium]
MRRSASSGSLRIHLIAADAVVSERVRRVIESRPQWSATRGRDFPFPPKAEVILIPASLCVTRPWNELHESGRFLLAYGPAEQLENCYLRGCDDYLKDPWDGTELMFRLERFCRPAEFCVGDVRIRVEADRLVSELGSTGLTEAEQHLLQMLLRKAGAPVTREALFYAIWGVPGGSSRLVDVYVSRLRRRILEVGPGGPPMEVISSVRGVGYSLNV